MNDLEIDSSANLYAFVSESRKEHNFVKHKQSGQYCHTTTQKVQQNKKRRQRSNQKNLEAFSAIPH